jgi:uncharacterized OB-fold protein
MLDTQRRENNIPHSYSSTINKSHQPSSSSSYTPRSAYPVTPSTTPNSGEDSSIPPVRLNQLAGARPEVKVKAEPEVEAASASASPAPSAPAKKKKKRGKMMMVICWRCGKMVVLPRTLCRRRSRLRGRENRKVARRWSRAVSPPNRAGNAR